MKISRDTYRVIRFVVPFLLFAAILRPLFVSGPLTVNEIVGYIGLGIMLGAIAQYIYSSGRK